MRVLAYYLPQFHRIKENDEWWGEGYTEWNAVKEAKPLFRWHKQPSIPLNENYYNLCDNGETWKWQSELAKKYGIYGFAIYHYWSNEKKLLEKPVEYLLEHKDIAINFCFVWANHSWTRTWYSKENEVLWPQKYDKKGDIISHFYYLLPFFKDDRYIKVNNKPLVVIYDSIMIPYIETMRKTWDYEAKKNGFDGLYLVSGLNNTSIDYRSEFFDAYSMSEPGFTITHNNPLFVRFFNYFRKKFSKRVSAYLVNTKLIYRKSKKSYINMEQVLNKKIYPSSFANWDNTPRRKNKGFIYYNVSPSNFGKQIKYYNCILGNDDYIFINAWNEWGEGCHLEPDTVYGYSFLKQVKENV